jgi:hypothetical protein
MPDNIKFAHLNKICPKFSSVDIIWNFFEKFQFWWEMKHANKTMDRQICCSTWDRVLTSPQEGIQLSKWDSSRVQKIAKRDYLFLSLSLCLSFCTSIYLSNHLSVRPHGTSRLPLDRRLIARTFST